MKGHFITGLRQTIATLSDLTSDDDAGKVEFIGCINGTPPLDGGISYFGNGDYYWTNKAGNFVRATGMRDLLAACGFSTHINFSEKKGLYIIPKPTNTMCGMARFSW